MVCGALATSTAGFLLTLGVLEPWHSRTFGNLFAHPPLAPQWAGAAILAFSLAWTTVDIGSTILQLTVAAAALMEVAALSWLLGLAGIAWPPFTTMSAGVLATLFGLLYNRSPSGRRTRLIRALFAGRISSKTERALIDSNEPLNISGNRVEASVVICEIFNHQLLAEALPPQEYVALTNTFLSAGAEALLEAGGTLDECGDRHLRAVFGAPLTAPNHAAQACEAACALARRLEIACRECIERWNAAPDYRIGVDSGELVAAAYGTGRVGGYSVSGDPLEFCKRLCVANMFYGSRILLGSRAFRLASGAVEVRPMELIQSQDRQTPEEIYELLAPKNQLTPLDAERRDMFWKGVILFRERRWDDATAHFQTALHGVGCEDAPARFYLDRIAHARAGDQALDWDSARL